MYSFQLQILHEDLKITAGGFFSVDFPLLLSVNLTSVILVVSIPNTASVLDDRCYWNIFSNTSAVQLEI